MRKLLYTAVSLLVLAGTAHATDWYILKSDNACNAATETPHAESPEVFAAYLRTMLVDPTIEQHELKNDRIVFISTTIGNQYREMDYFSSADLCEPARVAKAQGK
jgi:hypothetical protein